MRRRSLLPQPGSRPVHSRENSRARLRRLHRASRRLPARRNPPYVSAGPLGVRLPRHLCQQRPPTFYEAPMEISLEKWDTAVDSQAKAFLVAVREAAPLLSDGGRIVAITFAPGGRFGSWQPWVAMGAAKAAMESLVRYFAVALAERDITVNSISPGWVEDSVLNSLPEVFQSGLRDWQERGWTPMRRLGRPSDIGNAVALICSQEAGWITGQLIEVDGGASLVDAHLPLEFQGIARQAKVQGT